MRKKPRGSWNWAHTGTKERRTLSTSNGTNTGSSNDPNKDKRIRLKLQDIKKISEALRLYDHLPSCAPKTSADAMQLVERIYGTKGELKYDYLGEISRRFHVLALDEGWAARGSKR